MADEDIGALRVIEDENLVGLISERECARDVILKERSPKITPVRDIMTGRVPRVEPKDTVVYAMELMTRKRVRHLPVLRRGEIIGIVSIGDLVHCIILSQDGLIGQLENYIKGSYPA